MKRPVALGFMLITTPFIFSQGVGINVSSPQSMLDVEGNAAIGSTYSGTNPAPANGLIVEGDVGIGTSGPLSKLHVDGAGGYAGSFENATNSTVISGSDPQIEITNTNTTAGNYAKIYLNDAVNGPAAAAIGAKINNHTNNYGDLQFWTRGGSGFGTRLHIDENGYVGIGNTNPSGPLDVYGDQRSYVERVSTTGNDVLDIMRLERSNSTGNGSAGIGGRLSYYVEDGSGNTALAGSLTVEATDVTTGSVDSKMKMAISKNGSRQSVLTVTSDEYVGIRTETPNVALDIEGGLALRATTNAQITSNQNDYPIGDGTYFRLSTDALRNLRGITGGVNGKLIIISNVGANDLVLKHEHTTPSAENRIWTGNAAADLTVSGDDTVMLIYDGTSNRWRVINM